MEDRRDEESKRRNELLESLISRAWSDELFKARLIKDPVKAIEEELGLRIPDFINVKVLQETADTRYIVLPYHPAEDEDELDDSDLDQVSAGMSRIDPQICGGRNC